MTPKQNVPQPNNSNRPTSKAVHSGLRPKNPAHKAKKSVSKRSLDAKKSHGAGNENRPNNNNNQHKNRNSSKPSGGSTRIAKPRKMTRQLPKSNNKAKPKELKIPALAPNDIRVIPLGGVEQVGANMTAIEMNDQIIVIDAGIGFATEETPGIDYMVPNTTYLEANKHKIKALVITHGHLDHIGAIPFLIGRLGNPPIYSREFGALLIQKKATEFPGLKLNIKTVGQDDGPIQLTDDLKVQFFGLTHSIPDSTGVIIETPYGDIVSTGDVRVDNYDGVPTAFEIEQYSVFKGRKVLLMTMDSTGIPNPGWSISETQVIDTVDRIIGQTSGRLVVAAFASQVERLMEFIISAKKYGKMIVVDGRSMKTNLGIAEELKLTDFAHVITTEEMNDYPPHKLVMLVTGSQGEEFAALMRISNGTHKQVKLNDTDTIVLSSSVVPGNDHAVAKLKDNLFRTDAKVITYMDNQVHASGHGKRGELTWIHQQVDYKFFMPIHGNHYMLKMHAELAEELGTHKEMIVVPDNGSVIEIREKGDKIIKLKEKAPGDPFIVDGLSVSDTQHLVIRDRQMLAQDGIFMIVVMIDRRTKKVRKSPDLISRGFVVLKENQELLAKTRTMVKEHVEESVQEMNPIDFDYLKDTIGKKIGKYLLQQTGKRPVVIPVVLSA
jgi:ribonuclease J